MHENFNQIMLLVPVQTFKMKEISMTYYCINCFLNYTKCCFCLANQYKSHLFYYYIEYMTIFTSH